MKKEITGHQIAIVTMLSLMGLKLLALPSFLFESGREDNLYSFYLFLLFDLLILAAILFVVWKNKEFSFAAFCEKHFGRWGAKIIYILVFTMFFFKAHMLFAESFSYFQSTLYIDKPQHLYFFTMLSLMFFFAVFGIKAFFRTVEIFAWAFGIGLIICIAIPFLSGDTNLFLIPIQNGFGNVFLGGGERAFWFGDYLFLLILFDRVKFEKRHKKHFGIYLTFAVAYLILFYLLFFRIFGADMAGMRNAITDVVGYTRKSIGISSIDWLPILLMILFTCFQSGLFFFVSKDMWEKTTETKNPHLFSFVWIIGVILCVWLWLNNMQIIEQFARTVLVYPAIVLHYGLPLLFVAITLVKMLMEKTKNKNKAVVRKTKRGAA